MNRRYFLSSTIPAGMALRAGSLASPNDTVRVACVGLRGRGRDHIRAYSLMPNVEIAALCDIDESLLNTRPDLTHVRYGVIALGDRTYAETFCNGGRRFDRILSELGARRIGDILLHDASAGTMPEEVAAEWIGGWVALCREQIGESASA